MNASTVGANGWPDARKLIDDSTAASVDLHPILRAAAISFPFVFSHPFEGGNGRLGAQGCAIVRPMTNSHPGARFSRLLMLPVQVLGCVK